MGCGCGKHEGKEHKHADGEECCCSEEKGHECGCGHEHGHEHKGHSHEDECGCGCGHEHTPLTPEQEVELLNNYKKQLEQELKVVDEEIKKRAKKK